MGDDGSNGISGESRIEIAVDLSIVSNLILSYSFFSDNDNASKTSSSLCNLDCRIIREGESPKFLFWYKKFSYFSSVLVKSLSFDSTLSLIKSNFNKFFDRLWSW